jgi:hypothetical protein
LQQMQHMPHTCDTPQRTNTHPPQSQRACTTNNQTRTKPGPKDARVHYPDLKQQPHTRHPRTPPPRGADMPAPGRDSLWYRSPRPGPVDRTPDSSEPQQCAPTPEPPYTRDPRDGEMSMFHS